MTQEIRFHCWLGAGMYFYRPHLCWQSKCSPVCLSLKLMLMSLMNITIIIHCFVCLLFRWLLSDCISQFIRFGLGVCLQSISCMLVEFIDCQSKYCCFNKRYLSASRCSSPLFWCGAGLAVSVWSLNLFSENELPQQAGGVSFPPGPLFETVRWILSTSETWLEQKQLLLCMGRVWGQL